MHRSGTSLTANLLATMGVDMGQRLLAPDRTNPRGFFEDIDFLEFHRRAFRQRFPKRLGMTSGGHTDWGWNGTTAVTSDDLAPWSEEARRLVQRREASRDLWGFKDPRATLVLDFWDPILPAPVYVGVYRSPHRVADSIQRLAAKVFLRNPGYAWHFWTLYNRRLLDFVRRHRGRCFLMDIDSLRQQLNELPVLLRERLHLPLRTVDLREQFCDSMLETDEDGGHYAATARLAWPESFALYDELQREADLPGPSPAPTISTPTVSSTTPTAKSPPAGPEISRCVDVSIVIPTHNDAELLVEALASAERCSEGRYEILVGDDGSTAPESLRILECLRGGGHTILRLPPSGLPTTRNTLIRRARGRFLLPLDADNRLVPGFIERALEAFHRDPKLGVVYGDRRIFGQLTGDLKVADFDPRNLVHWNEIDACAMIRREVWEQVGGYDTRPFGVEDWELWINASKHGWRFQHLPGIAFEYRVRPDSMLTQSANQGCVGRMRRLMLEKHRDLLSHRMPAILRGSSGMRGSLRRGWHHFVTWLYWQIAWKLPRRSRAVHRRGLEALGSLERPEDPLLLDS